MGEAGGSVPDSLQEVQCAHFPLPSHPLTASLFQETET